MVEGNKLLGMQLGGTMLHAVAIALGARVTSFKRSPETNRKVGGSPTSAHLVGGAIDVGIETPEAVRRVLAALSCHPTDGLHSAGTAPHYHYTAGWPTVAALVVAAGGTAALIKGA